MRTKTRSLVGLLVIAAGLVAWRALHEERRVDGETPGPSGAPPSGASRVETDGTQLEVPHRREPEVDPTEPRPDVVEPKPAEIRDTRSPLARHVDEVAASCLTEQPRVVELLGLVHDLAERAVVDPESVQIERDEEGAVRFVRGALAVGDLRGTFLVEEDGYSIEFPAAVAQEPWLERSLHITFEERQSAVAAGHATVQFQPRPDATSAWLAPDREEIVGWGVGVSSEAGAQAIPITVRADGDSLVIGDGASVPLQEFPWISDTSGFDAWLRLLQVYSR